MATLVSRIGGHLLPSEGEVEERRVRGGKLFRGPVVEGRQRYRYGAVISPLHYRADPFGDEPFEEIDLDIVLTPGQPWDAALESNGYQIHFWQSRVVAGYTIRYIAQFRRAGKSLTMAPLALFWINNAGQRQLIGRPQAGIVPVIDNETNTVTVPNCFGAGLDFRYNVRPDEFFKTVIIRAKANLPAPTIGTSGLRLAVIMGLAWDGAPSNGFASTNPPIELSSDDAAALDTPDEELVDPAEFAYRDEQNRNVLWLQKPKAWDSYVSDDGPHVVSVVLRLRRKGTSVFALLSVTRAQLNAAQTVYPVYIDADISEEQVGASTDDAYSYGSTHPGSTTLNTTGTIVHFGATSSSFRCAGYRFQTIPIEPGVIIDSASLKVRAGGGMIPDTDVYIAAEDVDDGATWGVGHFPSNAHSNRTTAQVRWTITDDWAAGNWYEAPNIAAPVQEVINRPGWTKNNDLNLVIYNVSTSLPSVNAYRWPESYDSNPANAVKFNCVYHLGFDALLLAGD